MKPLTILLLPVRFIEEGYQFSFDNETWLTAEVVWQEEPGIVNIMTTDEITRIIPSDMKVYTPFKIGESQ